MNENFINTSCTKIMRTTHKDQNKSMKNNKNIVHDEAIKNMKDYCHENTPYIGGAYSLLDKHTIPTTFVDQP